ncbi:leucine/isoleucine/valine transporter permease subunit [Betaproteobacteria bacterium MOLA814]|jgi:branched-chain amino acid transport system permease protein|nr:leucine/isoleucine/valine transporter permease subunit [Betaproteobacteria bacterium MOLA814]
MKRYGVWWLFALVLLLAPTVFDSSLSRTLLSQMGIAIIVCLSFNMLLGQGGMLSFGHAVYSGMGGFLAIHTLNLVSDGQWWLPVSLIPVAGGLGAALVAVLLGWVTTKKAATPFAMITLGVGELVWAMSLMFPVFFGGEGGISGNRVTNVTTFGISYGPQIQLYYLIAAYTFVCTALMYGFTCTPLGRMLNATRDNPERVEFVGFDSQMVRYIAFIFAGFFAGISGGLSALNFEMVTAEVVSLHRSGAYLLFTFVGGATVFFGPVLGAVLMVLALVLLSELTSAWLLYLGLIFVCMVMFAPGGVAGILLHNVRVWQEGFMRYLIKSYLRLVLGSLPGFVGITVVVEMMYHRQLNAGLDPVLRMYATAWDTASALPWAQAGVLAVVGMVLFERERRRFMADWHQVQVFIERTQKAAQ